MRIFHNLTDTEQDNAVDYCTSLVLDDLLNGNINIEPMEMQEEQEGDKKEVDIQTHIKNTLKKASEMKTDDEKISLLLDDERIYEVIMDLAIGLCHSSIFLEPGENAIDMEMIADEEINEWEEDLDLPATKTKKEHNLN